CTLLVQDTTQVNYTHHPHTTDLGPVGDGLGRGFLLQSVLAVLPTPRRVLGVASAAPFLRQPAPADETRSQRQQRETEADAWARAQQPAGQAHRAVAAAPVQVQPPAGHRQDAPLAAWVVRVWEPTPPPGLDEPLEWLLLTDVPTPDAAAAWERAAWYRLRWVA